VRLFCQVGETQELAGGLLSPLRILLLEPAMQFLTYCLRLVADIHMEFLPV
jgi:hypothetical protein